MLLALRRISIGRDAHHQQGCNHRKVAEAIKQKTPAFANRRDYQSGDGRANQPRSVCHRRVDRDGITEVVAILDHLYQERLTSGHVEGIDQTLQSGERDNFPERDDMGQCERRQGERLDGSRGLCPHQHLAAIETLHPDTRKWSQQKRNNLPCKANHAQQQRRMGQSIDQPACGQLGHPGADHGDALTEKEKLEVAMP